MDSADSAATDRPAPHEIAFLRGGRRAALTVAVLTLRLSGSIGPGRGGTLRTRRPLDDTEADLPALTRAVHASLLHQPAHLRQLLVREAVALALIDLRYQLTVAGLAPVFLPGRTRAGRRVLRTLRARHPLPGSRRGLSAEDRLLAVALYGDRALTTLMPRFAREGRPAGRRGKATEQRREYGQSWGSGGGFSCGAV
ncbi:TIGR04222 domain-containing membrane protein [Streptomyces sp. MK5]|uniref:TIGR04222 domain-containing membrane protein n=1 Tax=Streptomyces sp. MK5 TaxID=3064253 RepID=UPI002740CEF8|nr:TIGR04222 domain-containing membrane protein [Streptomyces sp. MK5]